MYKLKISAVTLLVLLIVLFLHLYGMAEHLYIKYWFYDIIAHVLGGVGIAMSVYCVALIFNIECLKGKMWKIIPLTLIAGLAWEGFEIIFSLTGSKIWSQPYYFDTIKDLIDDVIGSGIVYLIFKNK